MDDDVILNRPSDRRLVDENNDLPPGPPGAENDSFDLVRKDSKSYTSSSSNRDKRDNMNEKDRRRSPSPPTLRSRDRRSRSRSRGKRRSPSRGHDYSPPDRRRTGRGANRFRNMRNDRMRSPPDRLRNRSRDRIIDRRRLIRDRSRSHDRYNRRRSRSRTRSRTRSRSPSPRSRRWSPVMKKPASPPPPVPPVGMAQASVFGVPPPQVYNDGYNNYTNQYGGQPFGSYEYGGPPGPAFNTAYPPPPPVLNQPIPPGDDFNANPNWAHTPVSVAAPVQQKMLTESEEDQLKRDAAVAQEVQNQRDQLKKQRNDYLKRAVALKREMKILKEQRNDLISSEIPPSPTTKGFLDENDRLQSQIQKKLSTIENVIDMLSSIIGEDKPASPSSPHPQKKSKKSKKNDSDDDDDSSPERLKSKLIESMKTKRDSSKKDHHESGVKTEKIKEEIVFKKIEDTSSKRVNYIFYDPEMHWCEICDVFPKTAKDYLNHLHSKQHTDNMKIPDTSWHDNATNDEFPTAQNATTKRAPIRGLQFFVPATSWYCKLCNVWMGDLHCASVHLKSQTHSEKYNEYIEQNPHFEVDWMADRQKVYDANRHQEQKDSLPPPPPQITSVSTTGMDLLESIPLQINNQKNIDIEGKIGKKKKKKTDDKKEKRKKKRSKKRKRTSSSSSSSSIDATSESESDREKKTKEDRANSIRVAMRNLAKAQKNIKTQEQQELDNRGKWIMIQQGDVNNSNPNPVPPPPPTMVSSKIENENRRKEELMMSQWNIPQPIISESEKKLLEKLKGKLKNKPIVVDDDKKKEVSNGSLKVPVPPAAVKDGKKLDRERTPRLSDKDKSRRSRSRNKRSVSPLNKSRDRRSRDKRSRSRERRSRSRDRRSRSRGRISPGRRRRRSRSPRRRSRSPINRYGGRRRSRSYSRSRSRSHSHRIEKPIVRYPEFRPRVPPAENKKLTKVKGDEESERKKSPATKKSTQSGKKLPFIGRMPVFKKQSQGSDGEKKEGENNDEGSMDQMSMGYDHYHHHDSMSGMMIDYDDLMPDPMQFVTLMGAPPPPPSGPPPKYNIADEKDILPPGIDETEADSIPKPISDAPIPRKGPLPKDFEEALNIIFPGEKKPEDEVSSTGITSISDSVSKVSAIQQPPEVIVTPGDTPIKHSHPAADLPLGTEIETIVMPPTVMDETSQHSTEPFTGYPTTPVPVPAVVPAVFAESTNKLSTNNSEKMEATAPLIAVVPPPPPPPLESTEMAEESNIIEYDLNENDKDSDNTSEDESNRQEELDDLALLGIDVDDLAAQCI